MTHNQEAGSLAGDLTNCDREPIHIPGRIQSHGILLALRGQDLTVVQAGANAADVLGVPVDHVLGSPFLDLVEPSQRDWARGWLTGADPAESNPVRIRVGAGGPRPTFDGLAHRHDGALIVELENRRERDEGPPPDYSKFIRKATARLQAARDLREFCEVAVRELRALTGFERVLVYRFDQDWHGEVVAEDRREDLTPLLGLHFPASDIPEPARRLYHANPIRQIVDVDAPTVPLVPAIHPETGRPLDLSFAALRAFSPVHVQYLKNMGARTSMSVSLMREDRLWGILACMHYSEPRYVAPVVRAACEFLGVLASLQIGVKEDGEGHEFRARLQVVRERLLQRMADEGDLVRALMGAGPELLELTGAGGAAVVYDDVCATTGRTPGEAEIKRLVSWLKVHGEGELYHTASLPRAFPEAAAYKDVACGLAAISTTRAQGHYVLWFRPEVIQSVDWGGDPNKPVDPASPGEALSPRKSFELWKEVVHLKSLPWRPAELAAARALRDAIIAVIVRRAEELTRLNAELERSNSDLDAFAFTTSHDMKEPLRGIHNYATFLMEDYGDRLDAEGMSRLQSLVWLSQRMEDLIESLLRFSRLGRAELSYEAVDVGEAVREVLDSHSMLLKEKNVAVTIPRPLPTVRCDRVQLGQLLGNLLTNAVKYNDKPEKAIEIGYADPRPAGVGSPRSTATVFYMRDNGIGIPEKHHQAIFRLFKRLHGRDKFGGGTGAGLTFAKKIAERHGGDVWLESTPGVGSTFYFTLGE
jgi:light-regulated signal transduction histidine kinase (bacteriophytochrome)